MKNLRSLVAVFFVILLTSSCEQFGVEVTTVKGEWKSENYKGQYLLLNITDNGMSHSTIHNDSAIVNRTGTWSLSNDTLSLFHQDFNANGIRIFEIEQMSMNTMTLRNLKNGDIWIMARQYSAPNNDYNSHFSEVFDLKRGFWWYTWTIASFVLAGLISISVIMGLFNGGRELIKWICKKYNK